MNLHRMIFDYWINHMECPVETHEYFDKNVPVMRGCLGMTDTTQLSGTC